MARAGVRDHDHGGASVASLFRHWPVDDAAFELAEKRRQSLDECPQFIIATNSLGMIGGLPGSEPIELAGTRDGRPREVAHPLAGFLAEVTIAISS